jgi:hypothetical protein
VSLQHRQESKVADAWQDRSTFAAAGDGNHVHEFAGEPTIRLAGGRLTRSRTQLGAAARHTP